MTTARTLLVAMGALALLAAAAPTFAIPTDQYLALRGKSGCDRRLTYAQVEANPAAYLHRVIEMRGTVNGAIRREKSVAFLLTLDDHRAILLDAPAADERLVSEVGNQMVRVLTRVTDGVVGNVVPLEVLGIAYDGEVTLRERQEEARMAAAQAAAPRASASRSRTRYSSRGGYYTRPMAGAAGAGSTGMLSEQAREYLTPEAQAVYPVYRGYIAHCNRRLSEKEQDDITVSLLHYSERHHVDPRLVIALVIAESDFDPRSTSNKGAMGLGQIMPDEARSHSVSNPYDPIQNMRTCINLLRMKLDLYADGSPDNNPSLRRISLALAAYNAGAGAVKKYGYKVPPYRETQNYVKKILRIYTELTGEARQ